MRRDLVAQSAQKFVLTSAVAVFSAQDEFSTRATKWPD